MNEQCPGSGATGTSRPYNAKSRPMTMVTCPSCGREWRKTGQSGAVNRAVPAHISQEGEAMNQTLTSTPLDQRALRDGFRVGEQFGSVYSTTTQRFYAVDFLLDVDVENYRNRTEALAAARRQRKAILAESTPEYRAAFAARLAAHRTRTGF